MRLENKPDIFSKDKYMYFNYHAKAKRLIKEGKCEEFEFVEEYHGIKPCLLLKFVDKTVMPIRSHRFEEYRFLLFETFWETTGFTLVLS